MVHKKVNWLTSLFKRLLWTLKGRNTCHPISNAKPIHLTDLHENGYCKTAKSFPLS
uniref:Uncharacterized protein n=1 Tax=Rhizophora mucronata TaxID=61149 RepID=A0A2P2LPK4_RHIMU